MSRFTGFQDDAGVAVLDTVTGSLVYHPFDGGDPRVLREPVAAEGSVPEALAVSGGERSAPPPRSQAPESGGRERQSTSIRAARRLEKPRPMVIRYPDADEVAAFKAARLDVAGGGSGSFQGGEPGNGER